MSAEDPRSQAILGQLGRLRDTWARARGPGAPVVPEAELHDPELDPELRARLRASYVAGRAASYRSAACTARLYGALSPAHPLVRRAAGRAPVPPPSPRGLAAVLLADLADLSRELGDPTTEGVLRRAIRELTA
jgi:hypothetical protein